MDWKILIAPLIGAVIGYCTNYIAVKMLFRPLRPIYIGTYQLPFTPGMIPKSKNRLAKSIGATVGKNLLTEDSFLGTLLSDKIKSKLLSKVDGYLLQNRHNKKTVREVILDFIAEDVYYDNLSKTEEAITNKILKRAEQMNLGDLIAGEVAKAIKGKVSGSLVGFVVTDNMIDSFVPAIASEIDSYVEEHGQELLEPIVTNECESILEMNIGTIAGKIDESQMPIGEIIWKAYENLIQKKLGSMLQQINISGMVEDKIVQMDVAEVEELVLSVMQKELNAIVNLGALIGLALGLINLFF